MRRIRQPVIRVLAFIGLLYILVTVTPIDRWWIRFLARPWDESKGEVLVVLGADAISDVIGLSSYWRSVYAVRAWREGGFRQVIVSGGSSHGEVPVAERMRDFMVSQGIPAAAIVVENQSHSTRENALQCKVLLDRIAGRKILMTSDFHTFRAYRAFRRAGIDIESQPLPDALKRANSWSNRWPVFLSLWQETAKIGYYYVRGWI